MSAAFLTILLSGCSTIWHMWQYKIPDIVDTYRFPYQTVEKPDSPFLIPQKPNQKLPASSMPSNSATQAIRDWGGGHRTVCLQEGFQAHIWTDG